MNWFKRTWPAFFLLGGPCIVGLLMLPGAATLRGRKRTCLEGIVTLEDLVDNCRRSGLSGWDLVAHAQRLVAHKFDVYTVWNLWDTPAQAFAFGMGYCTQYNLALKLVLDKLGIDSQAVSSAKVAVTDNPDWTLGHTWLRVRLGREVRDVCAGRSENYPGQVGFSPLKRVLKGNDFLFLMTHFGMILFVGAMGWRSWLSGAPAPEWTYVRRPAAGN